jgi:putative phosphoribosyl transferase
MFEDRREAGHDLLKRLGRLDPENSVILALPRGGLPVADVIADALAIPLDIVLVRKIGVPGQPEFAVAAVTDGKTPKITVNEDVARMTGLGAAEIARLAERELPEIDRRREIYLKGRPPLPLAGRVVVVVDDGIATGATMRAALRLVRDAGPARLIAAVPVGPTDTIASLQPECDEVICLECPAHFRAVGLHYREFEQVSDAVVTKILERHAHRLTASTTETTPQTP